MASIEKRTRNGQSTWRAHYRTPAGAQRNKTFARKIDAERFLAGVESSKATGSYVDPVLAQVTVGDWADRWLAGQAHLKPTTHERYAGILRKHIHPKWGRVRLGNVSHSDVQVWVTGLTKQHSAATVQKIHRVLSLVLDMAVKDGRLARNVATGVNLPRVGKHEHLYLTHEQVEDLAHACGYPNDPSKHSSYDTRTNKTYRLVVLFLAYTGVRFGEMAALKVARLDLHRHRAIIAASVTPVRGQGLVWGTPKSHERREVPIPPFLVTELAEHIAGKDPDDLVFAGIRRGAPLRVSTFRTAFGAAAKAIGVPDLHPHQLRHTAASLAIASGADVKVVQQMLGHSSATMTLDTYGHLFGDRLDEVGSAMDAARRAAQERRAAMRAVPTVAPVLPQPGSAEDQEGDLLGIFAGQGPFSASHPQRDSNPCYR
ncbi:MAG TPA: tyrosine-type recombinase/integrase, partial [Mycobacteriales bacterium]|nr:tyrosine-type recombinase/integrase [Mycobacteriales bacterium]